MLRKGRLSALAGGGDDDSGEEFEEDLLGDEDDLDAGGLLAYSHDLGIELKCRGVGLSTPGTYFGDARECSTKRPSEISS